MKYLKFIILLIISSLFIFIFYFKNEIYIIYDLSVNRQFTFDNITIKFNKNITPIYLVMDDFFILYKNDFPLIINRDEFNRPIMFLRDERNNTMSISFDMKLNDSLDTACKRYSCEEMKLTFANTDVSCTYLDAIYGCVDSTRNIIFSTLNDWSILNNFEITSN